MLMASSSTLAQSLSQMVTPWTAKGVRVGAIGLLSPLGQGRSCAKRIIAKAIFEKYP
jgi:hypothetical protein